MCARIERDEIKRGNRCATTRERIEVNGLEELLLWWLVVGGELVVFISWMVVSLVSFPFPSFFPERIWETLTLLFRVVRPRGLSTSKQE